MSDSETNLQKTVFYSMHCDAGAKMVPFAGYQMPINYSLGIIKEHLHARSAAGLFDVSHMGQISVSGQDCWQALERILPIDVKDLALGNQRYALFLNEQGGILDDLMVACVAPDSYLLVVNAACKEQDFAYLQQHIGEQCEVRMLTDNSLLALQGPQAATVLSSCNADIAEMKFMNVKQIEIDGISCFVSRSGYTGEDGFEIAVANQDACALAEKLLAHDAVQWVGLGARDSLRMEAGLCLYGHDITDQQTPIEGSIGWAISPARRKGGEREGGFPGSATILAQTRSNVTQQRVAFIPEGRVPVREGTMIYSQGEQVGCITSGGFAPSLGHSIAMGYVSNQVLTEQQPIYALVRHKEIALTLASLPFVANNYYR